MTPEPIERQPADIQKVVASVAGLDQEGTAKWLADALRSGRGLWPTRGERSRAGQIHEVFSLWPEEVQTRIKTAAEGLLNEYLAAGPDREPEYGDELLLLINYLNVSTTLEMLKESISRPETEDMPLDIRRRMIQTLLALNGKLDDSFLNRMLNWDPVLFSGLFFLGYAHLSRYEAIRVLKHIPDDERAAKQIWYALPGFFMEAGSENEPDLRDELWKKRETFKPIMKQYMEEYLELEGYRPKETANWVHPDFIFHLKDVVPTVRNVISHITKPSETSLALGAH
jgi:hypothetical protein